MRVLIVGSGGREHALAWKLAQEHEVHACPGNPGIGMVAECHPESPEQVANVVRPDLIVIGPEGPLIEGLADRLRQSGHLVFGPGAGGARLEGSKVFSKQLMLEAGVPTAVSGTFNEVHDASAFARQLLEASGKAVIKASGAALGKGVVICSSQAEVDDTLQSMLVDKDLGEAGSEVVVEEFLDGFEFSLLTLCNEQGSLSLPVAQDYKRALDNNRGPNTGGMGTYSPVASVSSTLISQTESQFVHPLLQALKNRGIAYRGVLFSGVMVKNGDPYCLEYNVRFGHPETQSVMRRLGVSFGEALYATARGEPIPKVEILDNAVVTVVMASAGYPGSVEKGLPISFGVMPPEVVVFHAGTAQIDGKLCTAGGRVLGVSAVGSSIAKARDNAYAAVGNIRFDGAQFRTDIGA